MSLLKTIREQQNLTQEELSARSGISSRTIQRIEAGTAPKGHTLKSLAKALNIREADLLQEKVTAADETALIPDWSLKLINLSSIPFVILPPLNILVPLIWMIASKQKNPVIRQIISIQIMWTILAPILFMLVIFTKPGNKLTLVTMIVLILINLYIILRNALEIDRNKKLHYRLNFNIL